MNNINSPAQLAVDSNSNVYVITFRPLPHKYSTTNNLFTPQWGNVQFTSATIFSGLTVDSNNYLYFSFNPTGTQNQIVRISPTALVQTSWVSSVFGLSNFFPHGLTFNSFTSLINVINGNNNNI